MVNVNINQIFVFYIKGILSCYYRFVILPFRSSGTLNVKVGFHKELIKPFGAFDFCSYIWFPGIEIQVKLIMFASKCFILPTTCFVFWVYLAPFNRLCKKKNLDPESEAAEYFVDIILLSTFVLCLLWHVKTFPLKAFTVSVLSGCSLCLKTKQGESQP